MTVADWKVSLSALEERYVIIEEIGKGAYGDVYKCKDKQTGEIVALKRIRMLNKNEGFGQNTIREISILRSLNHDNIVGLRAVVTTIPEKYGIAPDACVYLAFEYCEFDLYGLLYKDGESILERVHIVSYVKQLLLALKFCHDSHIVHRDLKPANLFITRKNVLKLGDFGLARVVENRGVRYTANVVTLHYRAPELLFGCMEYLYEIDMWSVGCIMYEMFTKEVLFRARSDSDRAQLEAIFHMCGVPTKEEWPEFQTIDKGKLFAHAAPTKNRLREHLEEKMPKGSEDAIDLLMQMLPLCPSKRITTEGAIMHPFIAKYRNDVEPSHIPTINFERELHQKAVSESRKRLARQDTKE